MRIKDIFSKDLFRQINGVVKVNELDPDTVAQELEEYVVTKELDQHFQKFFSVYGRSLGGTSQAADAGNVGVWISGFFGSGKSHFLKILHYLLGNVPVITNGETKKAIDFFDDKISDALLLADIKKAVGEEAEIVLFNIDSKAGAPTERDAILSVFYKVFNERLGYCGDYPSIAEVERHLSRQGKLESFNAAFKTITGKDWHDERDAWGLWLSEVIKAISQVLGQSESDAKSWFECTTDEFDPSIEHFAKRVKEHLDTRGPNARIVFMVDEVGQFIGDDTHLMLSLQTITENLGTICEGRAWLLVTSQEDIDSVIGELGSSKSNDFSKITGRFRTRLSLSSSNVDEVIQIRLLEKTEDASKELSAIFDKYADIIRHQQSFDDVGMTFKQVENNEDFAANYPFAPYQFQLLQRIFETIRKVGVTGAHLSRGERSLLDAFQTAAQAIADHEIGALVPLHEFYPSIESFLDTKVKRAIDQAAENPSLEPQDVLLLKSLFLIRYVDEVKGSVDNLVTLLVDKIEADRIALKKQAEESLQRLDKQTLVGRNGDVYFFLTDEERDIGREIKLVELTGAEEAKFLTELVFSELYRGQAKFRYPGNGNDFDFNRICDGHEDGRIDDKGLFLRVVTPLSEDYEFFGDERCIADSTADGGSVIIRLPQDDELEREIRALLRTDKYIRQKSDPGLPLATRRILSDRQDENWQRRERLIQQLNHLALSADYFSNGRRLELDPKSPSVARDEALIDLVDNTFSKLGFIKHVCDDPPKEIQAMLRANDIGQQQLALKESGGNPDAVDEVRKFIDLSTQQGRQIILREVANRFSARPYGWPEMEIVIILARLFVLGEISLVVNGAAVAANAAFDPLTKRGTWNRIQIVQKKAVDSELVDSARKLANDLFVAALPDTEQDLRAEIERRLGENTQNLQTWAALVEAVNYPGKDAIDNCLRKFSRQLGKKEDAEFFEAFAGAADDLREVAQQYRDLNNFFTTQRSVWDKLNAARSRYELNRFELSRDDDIAGAMDMMDKIASMPEPYGVLKEVEGLLSGVNKANTKLLKDRRKNAQTKIDEKIEDLKKELDQVKADPGFRNEVLTPLQDLKKRIDGEEVVSQIYASQMDARAIFDEKFDAIRVFEAKQKGGKKSETREVVEVSGEDILHQPYIETEEDVENFIAAIRTRLEQLIKKKKRVRFK